MPESLEKLFLLTNSLAWLTLNFDGMTTLMPIVDHSLDEKIEQLYHKAMDMRPTGGDSRTGRKLFEHVRSFKRGNYLRGCVGLGGAYHTGEISG